MPSLSKMSDKCKKCPDSKTCNNKRMVACAVMEMPEPAMAKLKSSDTVSMAMSNIKPYTPITINMGDYGTVDTSLEEIHKQIEKQYRIGLNVR